MDFRTTRKQHCFRQTMRSSIFSIPIAVVGVTDRMSMLRPLPERKTRVYFSKRAEAERHRQSRAAGATTNAALRAHVIVHAIDARGLVAQPPLGDASRPSPADAVVHWAGAIILQTTFSARRTRFVRIYEGHGGNAISPTTTSRWIVRAARVADELLHHRVLQHPHHTGRAVPRVRVSLTNGLTADLEFRAGYFAAKRSRSCRRPTGSASSKKRSCLRIRSPTSRSPWR